MKSTTDIILHSSLLFCYIPFSVIIMLGIALFARFVLFCFFVSSLVYRDSRTMLPVKQTLTCVMYGTVSNVMCVYLVIFIYIHIMQKLFVFVYKLCYYFNRLCQFIVILLVLLRYYNLFIFTIFVCNKISAIKLRVK